MRKNFSDAQKLSRRAKTFPVAMLPCYRGFWASAWSPLPPPRLDILNSDPHLMKIAFSHH